MNNNSQITLLQALIDSIPDLIFYKDKQSLYLGCNKAFESLVGISRQDIVGKTDFDLFSRDVAELFRQKDIQMLISGESKRNEEWVDYPDGSKVLLDTLKTPYFSNDGAQLGLIGVSRDITALHESREQVKLSLSLQQAAMESTADGILVVGKKGNWEGYNRKFLEMWHVPASIRESGDDDAAITYILGQLLSPEDFICKIKDLYAAPLKSSFDEVDFKDGRIFERYSIPQMLDGDAVGRVWSFRDVTERKQSEHRISEMAAFAEYNPGPVLRVNQAGRILEANPIALEEFEGLLKGSPVAMLPGLENLNLEYYIANNTKVLRTGEHQDQIFLWVVQGISELNVVHIYGSSMTEQKWLTKHVHSSSADLKRILDSNPVPTIVTLLSDGTLFYANQATAEMMGVAFADLLGGRTPDYFVCPKQRPILMNELLQKQRIDHHELQIKRPDGSQFWASTSLRIIEFDGKQCVIASFYDLTEVKAHEAALISSEKRYSDLIEVLPDALVVHQNGKIVYANTAAAIMFGYDDREEGIAMGIEFVSHIHPDFLTLAMQRVQSLMKQEEHFNDTADEVLLRLDGTAFDAEVRSVITNYNGSLAVMVSIRDITERKRSEMLTQMNNRILESVSSGQPLTKSLTVLAEGCEALHRDLRISIMLKKGDKLYPETAPSLTQLFKQKVNGLLIAADNCSCGSAAFYGKRIISKSVTTDPLWEHCRDALRPFNFKACWSQPILSGEGEVLGTFAMICSKERGPDKYEIESLEVAAKLASMAIERFQTDAAVSMLSQAVEQAGEAIIITDRRGFIEYVNQAFTTITGYTREDTIGQSTRMLRGAEQDEMFFRDMFRHFYRGEPWQARVRGKRKCGQEYTAQVSAAGIRDRDGKLTQLMAVYEDMSKYDELEAQLRQSQKMEAIGTLVGGIAHDFNNILAGMTGQLFLLRQELVELPASRHRIGLIESQAFRAAEMIDQLLTFARKGRVSMKPIPLTALLKETMKLHRVVIPENINLDIQLHDDSLIVNGDAGMIQQVLLNLLSNARDAVEAVSDPHITVILQAVAGSCDDSLDKDQREVCLEVVDNGCGIAPECLDKVCEPFFTTKDVGKGTGLGLSMLYGAVQTHHGRVLIDSDGVSGTVVKVFLPRTMPLEIENKDKKMTSILSVGQAQTILLADDDEALREVMAESLEVLGYHVLVANDGEHALRLFKAHQNDIELAILDVIMPNMGGVEASQYMHKLSPELPIIFYTGYDQKELSADVLNRPNCRVIKKPVMIESLSQMIAEILQ